MKGVLGFLKFLRDLGGAPSKPRLAGVPLAVQLPATQGHDIDMGTTQNTAANLAALMMGSRYKQPA